MTEYYDGAAQGLDFLDAHQLLLFFKKVDADRPVRLMIDFEESRVFPALSSVQVAGFGSLHHGSAAVEGLEAEVILESEENGPAIEIRREVPPESARRGRLVRRIERAGRNPMIGFSAEGKSLYSSATEVLSRWNLETGRAQKFKCHDRVTHVATIGRLLAAQNRQGVISIFDATRRRRLICVRPTLDGWIAFADDGAWDCSEGFTRGVELSASDAKSTAFIPGEGFGWLENNHFPLTRVIPPRAGRCRGLIALRTAGFW